MSPEVMAISFLVGVVVGVSLTLFFLSMTGALDREPRSVPRRDPREHRGR
jgi:hypothetical protein